MAEDAKVKVTLETKDALRKLAGLTREAANAAGKVSRSVSGALRTGIGAVGLGGGVAAGAAAVQAATRSGAGDLLGEVFRPIGAALNEAILGDLDDKARAARSAREETIQAFGAIAGETGRIPPGAKQFFDQVRALRENEERGRALFDQSDQ
jgi:hypothetical protein